MRTDGRRCEKSCRLRSDGVCIVCGRHKDTRNPGDPDYGFYSEAPCMGCDRPMPTTDPTQRQCQECRCEMLEGLAHQIDPAYDPAAEHEWPECAAVLSKLGVCP